MEDYKYLFKVVLVGQCGVSRLLRKDAFSGKLIRCENGKFRGSIVENNKISA